MADVGIGISIGPPKVELGEWAVQGTCVVVHQLLPAFGGLLVHEGWHIMEIFTIHPGNTRPYNTYPWNQAEVCLRTL